MARKLIVVLLITVMCLLVVTSALAIKYREAPMLRTKVAAGELPPIEQRLPEEPLVVGPGVLSPKEDLDFEVGRYGGTLRLAGSAVGWDADVFVMQVETLLDNPGIGLTETRPNIIKDIEVSDDAKVFTLHMRKGLKWSDGVPVTTEDVLFAYEDVMLNEELTPVFPTIYRSANKPDGEPMELDIIDDYTFRISFAESYKGFTGQLSQLLLYAWRGYQDLLKPKHYLKNFHIRYTSLEKLEPLIEKEGLAKGEWWTLFNKKDIALWDLVQPQAVGFPALTPWIMVKVTPQVTWFERNPYYFKVDTEGNQLPYIDKIRLELIPDVEMATMKTLAGEIDLERENTDMASLSLYKENEKKGGYRTLLFHTGSINLSVWLNLSNPDPVWSKVVNDIRFRKALNFALNREEISDVIYFGFVDIAPEGFPSAYDPEKANQLLDEVGLDKRDAEGWRLGPDGKRFVIPIEHAAHIPLYTPAMELVKSYWEKVGIKTTVKKIDKSLWSQRADANEMKATVLWTSDMYDIGNLWGPAWFDWYNSGGKLGIEPPAEAKKYFQLRDAVKALTLGSPEQIKVLDEMVSIWTDNLFFFPLTGQTKRPVIVSQRLGNIPHGGLNMDVNFNAEQLFYKR